MKYEIVDHEVLTVETVKGKKKTHIVKKGFDRVYHIKLSVSKNPITANGLDSTTITAQMYNYLDEINTTWTGDIIFTVNGETQTMPTVNGKASITFSSDIAGTYEIATEAKNVRGNSIKVVAE